MNTKNKPYPNRAPKKYPKKDLHGRVRFMEMQYKDFRRYQKFWVDLFGWDMFELPEAAGGRKPGSAFPSLIIATGPSYETWEGVVPGHMNVMANHADDGAKECELKFSMEIHMDEPIKSTADNVARLGGSLVGELPEEKEGWVASLTIADPSGNIWNLGKCPSSRTWDEAEAGYDKD
jgi:predicted enzyme related to lactoylglutathione lyase